MFLNTTDWIVGEKLPSNFNVRSQHAKYTEMLPYWQKCRDARLGAKAIKEGGNREKYLPRLDSQVIHNNNNGKTVDQKDREYNNYRNRATWYGGTGKTVQATRGIIFANKPKISANPKEVDSLLKESDIINYATQNDESFFALMELSADEIITVNRVGILEDYPVTIGEDGEPVSMSLKEYEEQGLTSYSVMYKAEQIINWGTAVHKGKKIESWYNLEEKWMDYEDSATDPTERSRWRILLLEEQENKELRYKQVVVEEGKDGDKIKSMFYPMINNEYFDYIPFWCLSTSGNVADEVREPDILDLVEMNIGHYRNSADNENELHYLSIATGIFPGWPTGPDDPPPVLGGALATPPDQTPYVMKAEGQSGIQAEMKTKEERMAILGAQMLASKGRYIQSAKTSEIENQGQSGILGSLSSTLETFFSIILALKIEWSFGKEAVVAVAMDKEYLKNNVTIEALTPLLQGLQSGKVSFDTFYYNMSKLGMYPDNWTKEDEQKAIEQQSLGANSEEMFTVMDSLSKRIMQIEEKLSGKEPEVKDGGAAA